MVRNFVLVISVFSFVMLSFASLAYCYAGDSDDSYSGRIEVSIDSQSDDFDIFDTYLDCHSYGSCHAGAHIISTILPPLHTNLQSAVYDLTVSDNIILQRLYPPFQPPIS